jgi:hypothetical protein
MDGSDRCQVGVVEGYSGAGKGFFAGHLAAVPGAEVINSDDLVPGWSGRAEWAELLAEWVLHPSPRERRRVGGGSTGTGGATGSGWRSLRPRCWSSKDAASPWGPGPVPLVPGLADGTWLSDVGEVGIGIDPEGEFVCQDPSVA